MVYNPGTSVAKLYVEPSNRRLAGLQLRGVFLKSWGTIFITAVGFLVGIVLVGVGGLSAKTTFFSSPNIVNSKKIEKYWADSGISEKELFDLISNSNCQSSEKYFLACVNSVTQNLSSDHKYLSSTSGQIESPATNRIDDDELTEKQRLSAYTQMYVNQLNQKINFEKIWKKMLRDEKPETKATLIGNGINSFLSVYKDPHTYILPGTYYEEVGSQLERSNLFVGVSFEKLKGKTIVRKVFKNSDAEAAGLLAFDELTSINGTDVESLNLFEISQLLRDPNAQKFDFKIVSHGEKKQLEIKRSFKKLSHVQFEILTGLRNYGVVTLTKFSRGVCEDIANKIKSAFDKNISGLVLDLRDNPGGQLDEAACIAGLFLGMNKRAYSVEFFDPLKSNEIVLTTGSLLYTGPLVVLVNSSSASASELLAGAMKDYKRALIVGEKTFGKGTFQESEVWSKNPKVSLFKTQGYYLLPSHTSPQLNGIRPDIVLDEQHIKLREDNLYFNPIQSLDDVLDTDVITKNNYEESLQKCLDYSDVIGKKDSFLQKSLQILSCHRITSMLAQQYSPADFN